MADIDEALLLKLLEEKKQLLAEFPELRVLQAEIDEQLSQVKQEPEARLKKMFELMNDIVDNELKPELKKLKEKMDEVLPEQNIKKPDKRRLG